MAEPQYRLLIAPHECAHALSLYAEKYPETVAWLRMVFRKENERLAAISRAIDAIDDVLNSLNYRPS